MKTAKLILRVLLGLVLIGLGLAHLTFDRLEYQAQLPAWMPLDAEIVVVASGILYVLLGLGVASWGKIVPWAGLFTALFFVFAVFPVRVSQYLEGIDSFWFTSDRARLARLFIQPFWILWAVWSTSALSVFRRKTTTTSQ